MSMFRDAEEDAVGDSHILSCLPSENEMTTSRGQTRIPDQCSTWGDAPQTNASHGSSGAEVISDNQGFYGHHGYHGQHGQQP
jgi:hypothetical protein